MTNDSQRISSAAQEQMSPDYVFTITVSSSLTWAYFLIFFTLLLSATGIVLYIHPSEAAMLWGILSAVFSVVILSGFLINLLVHSRQEVVSVYADHVKFSKKGIFWFQNIESIDTYTDISRRFRLNSNRCKIYLNSGQCIEFRPLILDEDVIDQYLQCSSIIKKLFNEWKDRRLRISHHLK